MIVGSAFLTLPGQVLLAAAQHGLPDDASNTEAEVGNGMMPPVASEPAPNRPLGNRLLTTPSPLPQSPKSDLAHTGFPKVSTNPTDRIIIAHPHKSYDRDCKGKVYADSLLAQHAGPTNSVLVLQGFESTDRRLPIYLDSNNFCIIPSKYGNIAYENLDDIIVDGAVTYLLGGIVDQCHWEAFLSIVGYLHCNNIHDVEVVIPFDGCYFKHGWFIGIDPSTWFDGIHIGALTYEMLGADSYTLREVVTKSFGELTSPLAPDMAEHRKQILDVSGIPVPASLEVVRHNIEAYFLKQYFDELSMGEGFNEFPRRDYDLVVNGDAVRIMIS